MGVGVETVVADHDLSLYLPIRSASVLVRARTRLWTLKPVCRHERMRSAGLDGDDDAGNEPLARQRLEIDREGLDRRPAELS